MSEVQNKEAVENQPEVVEQKEETVSKNAYKKVSEDMHKYKSQMKEFQSQLEVLRVEKEQTEKQKLIENEKWQDLYKKSEEKLKQIASERDSERQKFIDSHKKNAVIQALGGFKRSDYAKFVDVSTVELADDGSINEETVMSEVNRIRKEFPELLKTTAKSTLPDKAPSKLEQKSINDMSPEERSALRRNILTNKS